MFEPFRQGLHDKGWVEGKNFVIESRWAEGNPERIPDLVTELIRMNVEVIVAGPPDALVAARKATQTIPIVAALSGDPMRYGLSNSYSRPTANVTGLTAEAGATIGAKVLEFLKQTAPGVRRIAVLSNPTSVISPVGQRDMEPAAKLLKLQLHSIEAARAAELEGAFSRAKEVRADALYVMAEPLFFAHRLRIAELAIQHHLPAASPLPGFANAGGLIDYSVDLADNWRRAAGFVDRLLRGAKPEDLPFEQPTKFQFVVNRVTAKRLGLNIPQSVLLRADRVIE